VRLVRLIFPGVGMLVLSAWCLGVLNSHRRFFLSYASPVLFNLTVIVALLVQGKRGDGRPDRVDRGGGRACAGSALQFASSCRSCSAANRAALRPDLSSPLVRSVATRFGTVVFGRGVVQVSAFVDTAIASFISVGSVATLGYAQAISMLPVSLFGMSVSAAELPAMSGEVGDEAQVAAAIRARLDRGLARIAFFVVPSAAAFLLIGDVLAAGLYRGGAFTVQSGALGVDGARGERDRARRGHHGAALLVGELRDGRRDDAAALRARPRGARRRLGVAGVLLVTRATALDPRYAIFALTAGRRASPPGWSTSCCARAIGRRVGPTGVPADAWRRCGRSRSSRGSSPSARGFRCRPKGSTRSCRRAAVAVFGAVYLGGARLLKVDDARRA
jgi:putative peptidoglycan lipid II flippase